ncbi:hypothetical protein, partial [Nonomuraea sp. NPDC059022]|uniref:hypothetical protein n=1 Tax=Nonomuraea sp. NPDC059022 TaxID=3346705 RepID=UPI00368DBD25
MIRRLFYLSLGAFTAVWVMRRLQAMRPEHVARRTVDNAAGLLEQVRDFTSDGGGGGGPAREPPGRGAAGGARGGRTPRSADAEGGV